MDIRTVGKKSLPPSVLSGPALRQAILRVSRSQGAFAALLGVSPNVVSGWIRRGAPGPVVAYLRLHEEMRGMASALREQARSLYALGNGGMVPTALYESEELGGPRLAKK